MRIRSFLRSIKFPLASLTRTFLIYSLISSDLISRGIDISHVGHVVSYDAPVDVRKYVHRVGRTARAGRNGDAWCLVEEHEVGTLRFGIGVYSPLMFSSLCPLSGKALQADASGFGSSPACEANACRREGD